MLYQLVGKSKFTSKKGSICTALHLIDSKTLMNGEGHAVCTKVTTYDCDSVKLGKVNVVFDDRGFVASVTEA